MVGSLFVCLGLLTRIEEQLQGMFMHHCARQLFGRITLHFLEYLFGIRRHTVADAVVPQSGVDTAALTMDYGGQQILLTLAGVLCLALKRICRR